MSGKQEMPAATLQKQNKPQRMHESISSLAEVNFQLDRLIQEISHSDNAETSGKLEREPQSVPCLMDILNGGPERIMEIREGALDRISHLREVLGL